MSGAVTRNHLTRHTRVSCVHTACHLRLQGLVITSPLGVPDELQIPFQVVMPVKWLKPPPKVIPTFWLNFSDLAVQLLRPDKKPLLCSSLFFVWRPSDFLAESRLRKHAPGTEGFFLKRISYIVYASLQLGHRRTDRRRDTRRKNRSSLLAIFSLAEMAKLKIPHSCLDTKGQPQISTHCMNPFGLLWCKEEAGSQSFSMSTRLICQGWLVECKGGHIC